MFQGNPDKHTSNEKNLFEKYADYFEKSPLPTSLKLSNFSKYARRQDLSRFLAKNEIFKLQLDIPGSIIECGCFAGGGLMTYAQLSSIYEPYNHQRRIFGFDTFQGFPLLDKKDHSPESNWKQGDLKVHDDIVEEINSAISLHDENRAVNHIPKTELIVGDATVTIPAFLKENPHVVISLLYLDFDLFEPTKVALTEFINRIPKGGILAFDELNTKNFPGETLALLDTVGIKNLQLRKTIFDPYISFAQFV
jgi:hypothetical protein